MGGFLWVREKVKCWFPWPLTIADEAIFGYRISEHNGQQVWEALAVLCGLRATRNEWKSERAVLEVRSDSVATLAMVATMRARTPGLNLIARELALELAEGCFRPQVVEHIPGVANCIADGLSRKFQPGAPFILPYALVGVPELDCPQRDRSYYKSLITPPGGLEGS